MHQVKNIQGERLDTKPPNQNCRTCKYSHGRLCIEYGALIQTNGHTPNYCKGWVRKDTDNERD